MILRAQQIVNLFGIDRGLDELKGHPEKIPQWRSSSMRNFALRLYRLLQFPKRFQRLKNLLDLPDAGFGFSAEGGGDGFGVGAGGGEEMSDCGELG